MREIVNMILAALARARTEDGNTPSVTLWSDNVLIVVYSDRDNRTRTFRVTVTETSR